MAPFNLDHIKLILAECREYEPSHHMGRPFMSAYQIAIELEHRFPRETQDLPVGGVGTGERSSLAQRLAGFLSSVIRDGADQEIEGGFISHSHLAEMRFVGNSGADIHVSTSAAAHSIFRLSGPRR